LLTDVQLSEPVHRLGVGKDEVVATSIRVNSRVETFRKGGLYAASARSYTEQGNPFTLIGYAI
jgi:hypothetical protein